MRPNGDYRQLLRNWLRTLFPNPNKSMTGLSPVMRALNLAYSFVAGFFLAKTRRTSPHAWKHTESYYWLVGSVLSFPERERQKMYYRVAIKIDSLPIRQWKSTVLS